MRWLLPSIKSFFLTSVEYRKSWADSDSPRTKDMWEDYDQVGFPVSPEDGDLVNKLNDLHLYIKKGVENL